MVYQNHKSRSFRVRRGVPQGSVLGHVLFSLFISNLPVSLPSFVSCSLYAADLAICSFFPSVPTAMETTQRPLTRLERWSEYWYICLNASKCEVSFFSVDPHQANLQPNLLLLNSRLRFNPTPTFLGVTFDRTVSFSRGNLRPPQSLAVSLVLSVLFTLVFSRTGGVLSHLNSLAHRFPQFPPRNLWSLIMLAVFSLVYAATDTAFC